MYEDIAIKNITCFGDWHENYRFAVAALQRAFQQKITPDAYIHVGDFGLWGKSSVFLQLLELELVKQNREIWFIDGNHENFNILKELPFDDRGLQKVTDHIFRIPRGYAWKWAGKTLVGLGGAFSVDMRKRTPGFDWFPDELITESDFEKTVSHGSADILFTHEAPWLPGDYSSNSPSSLKFELTPEEIYYAQSQRDYIAKALNILTPVVHFHGHHHIAYVRDYFGTKVIGLNKDKRAFDENAVEIDLTQL